MRRGRLGLRNLAAAAVLAAVAALLTAAYAQRAGRASPPAAAQDLATVYVAARDVPAGTAGSEALDAGLIVPRRLPRAAVAPGSATTADEVRALVAVQPLYAGEQAARRRFGPSGATGVRGQLSGTRRVLAVPGTPEQLLAGMLAAGDHVDVVASLRGAAVQEPTGATVLRNLLVVRAPTVDRGRATAAAVVELTDVQAQRLFFVIRNGDWSFVLRPPTAAAESATRIDSAAAILGRTGA